MKKLKIFEANLVMLFIRLLKKKTDKKHRQKFYCLHVSNTGISTVF
jgi:hypothetical protein